MLAILGRELRAESRRGLTYWLRVLTVGVVVATCFFLARQQDLPRAEIGVKMFGGLNAMLFGAIWVLIPLLSADCLSREKREATLGLLFLTPLRPGEVVHAKVLVHLLRAGGLLLAVVPAMTVPFLFGGVTWRECVVALSAGLLASALCKQWVRALVLAETLSLMAMVLFVSGHAHWHATRWGAGQNQTSDIEFLSQLHLATGWDGVWNGVYGQFTAPGMITGPNGAVMQCVLTRGGWTFVPVTTPVGRTPSAVQDAFLYGAEIMLAFSLVFLLHVSWFARRKTRRDFQEDAPARWAIWLHQTFCQPVYWQSLFQRRMRVRLGRNPISWLQQYSWSARVVKWGLCLLIISAESSLLASVGWWEMRAWQIGLLLLTLAGVAFSAAGSFHDEKHSGALELLLVAPLKEWQIIWGRLAGIMKQFLPASLIICVTWHFTGNIGFGEQETSAELRLLMNCTVILMSVAIIGLYWAITRVNFFTAWLLTVGIGIGTPVVFDGADARARLDDRQRQHAFWLQSVSSEPRCERQRRGVPTERK
jgi:ABC-type transport system involved in multi-copper enzyme maturation permease subunit